MYLIENVESVDSIALKRGVESLITGLSVRGYKNNELHSGKWDKALYLFAELCITGAFPNGLPRLDDNRDDRKLYAEDVAAAVNNAKVFRAEKLANYPFLNPTDELNIIALECRWVLEGYLDLRLKVSYSLKPHEWALGLSIKRYEGYNGLNFSEIIDFYNAPLSLLNNEADKELSENPEQSDFKIIPFDEDETNQKTTMKMLKRNLKRAFWL